MGMIRKTASKEKIKQAFIVLLETEGFQKMTISSLVKQAGINRGTFYLNYLDKDDLAQQLVNDFFTDIAAILKQDNGDRNDWFSPAAISQIIEYVQNQFCFCPCPFKQRSKGTSQRAAFPNPGAGFSSSACQPAAAQDQAALCIRNRFWRHRLTVYALDSAQHAGVSRRAFTDHRSLSCYAALSNLKTIRQMTSLVSDNIKPD